VGTSQRVFPTDMKAAPLLRAWLQRLRHPMAPGVPVTFHMRHRWTGWDADGALCFDTPAGPRQVHARAVLLALGGGSWARLGSDGAWVPLLAARGVPVVALAPSNCGFDAAGRDGQGWTSHFRGRFAGQPFKSVAINLGDEDGGAPWHRRGEFVATATGVEGRPDDGLDRPPLPLLPPPADRHTLLYTEMVTTGALLHGDRRATCDSTPKSTRWPCSWAAASRPTWPRRAAGRSSGAMTRSTSTAAAPASGCSAAPSAPA
jgi:hypothetical protein